MIALVTGASSGIGKELCLLLSSQNFSLIITATDLSKLEKVAAELTVPVTCHGADLSNKQARASLIALIHETKPDLVINNAGFGLYGKFLSFSTEEQLRLLEVNAHAAIEITLESAKMLKEEGKKGTILNVSSAAAFFIYPTFGMYAAAKATLNSFSQAFDEEMAPQGIRILTCCPGPVATAFRNKAGQGYPQKADSLAISASLAAQLIYKQIKQQKRLQIIDWRMRLFVALTHFVPSVFLTKLLKRTLSDRYEH